MPFEYSCFISFRHSKYKKRQEVVNKIYQELSDELSNFKKSVFLDKDGLQKGDILDESIAFNLCRSACMIMIYTPDYLDESHTWCAREYKAMLELEEKRLNLWTSNCDKNHGLIIPIICRDRGSLLPELKKRLCYDWSTLLTSSPKYFTTTDFYRAIKGLAKVINERCDQLNSLGDLCGDCGNFTLPEEKKIKEWIQLINVNNNESMKQPFPGHTK